MNPITKLSELEAKLDTVLFREKMPDDYYDTYPVVNEKYRSELRKKRAGALATAAIGAGAYYGGKKLKGRYDAMGKIPNAQEALAPASMLPKIGEMKGADKVKQYGKAAMRDVKRVGRYGKAVASELGKGAGYFKSARVGASAGLGHSVSGAARSAIGRVLRGARSIKYEANIANRIVELDDKLDELVELRSKRDGWVASDRLIAPNYVKRKNYDDLGDDEFGYHPDKARRTVKAAAAGALVGAGLTGAGIDRLAQKHNLYRKAGAVYKTAGRRIGKAVAKLRGK